MSRWTGQARQQPAPGFVLGYALAIHGSPDGLLVEIGAEGRAVVGEEQTWIPRSQIHPDSEVYGTDRRNREGCLVVTRWLAKERGWTED